MKKFGDLRVTLAYVRLFLLPAGKDGSRKVSLKRIGIYEVRLVEMLQVSSVNPPPLWMELYAHDVRMVVDSCRCHDLEEAVAAAELLISQARGLNELSPG